MRIVLGFAAIALAACNPQDAQQATNVPTLTQDPAPAETPAVAVTARPDVEGWQTNPASYTMVGSTIPDFALEKFGGGKVTQDDLRNRWTILGFWSAAAVGIEEESNFIRALNSAADQDPDLDFQTVYLKLDAAETDVSKWFANNGGPWPTLVDAGETASAFNIQHTPAYILIGPDLTIEAYREALAATPDDGIKSVIRGVAEIRKQIVSPG